MNLPEQSNSDLTARVENYIAAMDAAEQDTATANHEAS